MHIDWKSVLDFDWGAVMSFVFALFIAALVFAYLQSDEIRRNWKKAATALNGKLTYDIQGSITAIRIDAAYQGQPFVCKPSAHWELTGVFGPGRQMCVSISQPVPEELAEISICRKRPHITSAKAIQKSDRLLGDPEFTREFVVFPLMTARDEAFLKSWLSKTANRDLVKNILSSDAVAISFDYGEIMAGIPLPIAYAKQFADAVHRLLPLLAELAKAISPGDGAG